MEIQKKLSRRDFIKITAMAGGAMVGGKLLFDLAAENFVTVKDTRLLMGTIINLTVVAESRGAGEGAVDATFAELERQVAIFNHREDSSPVAVLNRTGKMAKPPQELVEVLLEANRISDFTNGAFDVTVKPLVNLYQDAQFDLPDADVVEAALGLVDHTKVTVTSDEISFSQPGMAVTLDGIAKGYIVDAGTSVLRRLGFANVFVEAGGDLMACGKKEDDTPWKVGVQSPRKEHFGVIAKFNVQDQAVATSGDYMQNYSSDFIHHHILDARTGYSSLELSSATVIAPTCLQADALATAIMVMGQAGIQFIEELPSSEALLVTKEGVVLKTSSFIES